MVRPRGWGGGRSSQNPDSEYRRRSGCILPPSEQGLQVTALLSASTGTGTSSRCWNPPGAAADPVGDTTGLSPKEVTASMKTNR